MKIINFDLICDKEDLRKIELSGKVTIITHGKIFSTKPRYTAVICISPRFFLINRGDIQITAVYLGFVEKIFPWVMMVTFPLNSILRRSSLSHMRSKLIIFIHIFS